MSSIEFPPEVQVLPEKERKQTRNKILVTASRQLDLCWKGFFFLVQTKSAISLSSLSRYEEFKKFTDTNLVLVCPVSHKNKLENNAFFLDDVS